MQGREILRGAAEQVERGELQPKRLADRRRGDDVAEHGRVECQHRGAGGMGAAALAVEPAGEAAQRVGARRRQGGGLRRDDLAVDPQHPAVGRRRPAPARRRSSPGRRSRRDPRPRARRPACPGGPGRRPCRPRCRSHYRPRRRSSRRPNWDRRRRCCRRTARSRPARHRRSCSGGGSKITGGLTGAGVTLRSSGAPARARHGITGDARHRAGIFLRRDVEQPVGGLADRGEAHRRAGQAEVGVGQA